MAKAPNRSMTTWMPVHDGVTPVRSWWIVWIVTILATAVHGDNTLLSGQRWREHAYGLSLRPPLGSRLISQTADDALVRFYGDEGYTIRVYVKKSTIDLALDDLLATSIHQVGGKYPSATIVEQKQLAPTGKSGAVIYFRIPDPQRGPWVIGQAHIQLSPRIFVMPQLEVDLDRFEKVRGIFEAVIGSLDVQDPKQRDQRRATQVAQGQVWRETVSPQRLGQSLWPQQWLRIVDHGVDIGYMRVTQKSDTQMGQPGIRVGIRSRIVLGGASYDSISHFFVSNQGDHELWSIRTTARQQTAGPSPSHPANGPLTQSWAETGVRSKDKITITREKPTGVDKYQWQRPPQGYLSQALLHVLEQLLGHQDTKEMGFYAYHPTNQKITYRTTRVVPAQDGSYVVYTRPSPDQEEQASNYSATGQLQKRLLPGGRVMLPTNLEQLKMKWKIR